MKIAIYTRVSTKRQKDESQLPDIKTWLKAHGHDQKSCKWFADKDSGDEWRRDGLMALDKAIFDGKVKTVVVWKLDRLARSQRDGINLLCDWCERGVRVVSVTQQIDLSGKVGHLVAGVLFAIAEIDLAHIRERQAAGIAAAKAKGVYKGRKEGSTKADPERAKALKASGASPGEIMQALGIKSRSTLSKYLAS